MLTLSLDDSDKINELNVTLSTGEVKEMCYSVNCDNEGVFINEISTGIDKVGVDYIWMAVQCRKLLLIIVGCIYHYAHAHITSLSYISSFQSSCMRKTPVFILGDFNDN